MNISVFCGATLPRNPEYINAAHQLGILLAQHGHTLLYGGSNLGLMGVVSSATLERGGHVVGVIPSFFSEEIILSQLCLAKCVTYRPPLCFYCLTRRHGHHRLDLEVLVANQLGLCSKPMGLLNTLGFFNPQYDMLRRMEADGLYNLTDARYLIIDDQPESLLQMLAAFVPLPNDGPVARSLRTKA